MGAYENPPIIRDISGQILAKGFEDFSKSMASAIDVYGERKRKEAKERLAKEDALLKNEMQFRLDAVKKGDDWYKIASSKNVSMADGFRPIVMENLRITADAKLALLTEKDPSKRQGLYDLISKNETDLSSLGTMFETVYTDLTEKKSMDTTESLGKTFMYTGDNLEEQENSQYGIAALEGKLDEEQFKISYNMDPEFGYVMNIAGTGEKTFKTSIKSRQVAAGKGLIIDMNDTVKAGTDKVLSEITGATKELNNNLLKDEQDFEYTAYKTNEKGKEIAYGKTLERRKYVKMDEIDEAIRINAEAKVASFDDLSPSVQKAIFKYQLGQTGSFEDFISNSKGNAEKYKENLTNLYAQSIRKEIEKSLATGKNKFEKDENGNYYQVVKSKTTEFEKPGAPPPPSKAEMLISQITNKEDEIYLSPTSKYVLKEDGKYKRQSLLTSEDTPSWVDVNEDSTTPAELINIIVQIKSN